MSKNAILILALVFCFFSSIAQDPPAFFTNKGFFISANAGLDYSSLAPNPDSASLYVSFTTITSKIGYSFGNRIAAGFKGNYTFARSNVVELNPYWMYGGFIDYFPFKHYNIYLNGSLMRSNVCYNWDYKLSPVHPSIVSDKDQWFYGSFGAGYYLKANRFAYLNFEIWGEMNLNDCVNCGRKPISYSAGITLLPHNFKTKQAALPLGHDNYYSEYVIDNEMQKQGRRDAELHYKHYKKAGRASLITSFNGPLTGIAVATEMSRTAPKLKNLNYPDSVLIQNQDYYEAYTLKAKEIKKKKAWRNYRIGAGSRIAISVLLSILIFA
ncbi:MAG: hypothetical protein H0X62_05455 [Bacteroidetes bacterium]|nr:hypothetical protein [Bacteroidota bacterium]